MRVGGRSAADVCRRAGDADAADVRHGRGIREAKAKVQLMACFVEGAQRLGQQCAHAHAACEATARLLAHVEAQARQLEPETASFSGRPRSPLCPRFPRRSCATPTRRSLRRPCPDAAGGDRPLPGLRQHGHQCHDHGEAAMDERA